LQHHFLQKKSVEAVHSFSIGWLSLFFCSWNFVVQTGEWESAFPPQWHLCLLGRVCLLVKSIWGSPWDSPRAFHFPLALLHFSFAHGPSIISKNWHFSVHHF
jgi:hypothetical protein